MGKMDGSLRVVNVLLFFLFFCGINIWERLSWNFNAGKLSCVDTSGDQICFEIGLC